MIPVALPGDNGLPTAKEEDKDPAYELNKNGIVHRYRYDPTKPDGKGEYIGTMPAFPQGCDDWANARLYNCAKNDRQDEEGEDIMAPKISRVVRPNKDELQALFIKCKGSINKISNELSIGWTTAQKWLIDDGIIPEGAKQPRCCGYWRGCPHDQDLRYLRKLDSAHDEVQHPGKMSGDAERPLLRRRKAGVLVLRAGRSGADGEQTEGAGMG